MPALDPVACLAILVALSIGCNLKGGTGADGPASAVPVIAAFVDVRFAVMIILVFLSLLAQHYPNIEFGKMSAICGSR